VDFFRRIPQDLTEATTLGASMSLCAVLLMALLFCSELLAFLSTDLTTDVSLDVNSANTVRINFNVTFLDLHCDYVSVDVLDSLGTNRQNITKNVEKWQIDEDGIKRQFSGRNRVTREVRHEEHDQTLEEMHEDGVHVKQLTKADFDEHVSSNDMVFANFFAPWCIWCQRLHPTWEKFAETVLEKEMPISVVNIDCVDQNELCQQQRIQAFPTLRWFHGGEAQMPDYKMDRTVNQLVSYSTRKLELDEKLKDWEKKKSKTGKDEPKPRALQNRPEHPGCQVSGYLMVNRVPGNFHIEAHSVNHNLNAAMTNLSHVVNHLSFGEPEARHPRKVKKFLNGIPDEFKQFQPMDGQSYVSDKFHRAHHHYLKIVSTHFGSDSRDQLVKYQFLQQSQEVQYDEMDVPEARFSYDLSPMSVTVKRKNQKSWYEFLTSLFALIGGTFTTMGIIDGTLYKVFKSKKM